MRRIPTARKEKLPEGFSYPLGSEAVSGVLGDVPQLSNARIWFVWRDEYWASNWRQKLKARGEVKLLEVTHSPLSGERELRVYSVPSDYSVAAREHLLAELPGVRLKLLTTGRSSVTRRILVYLDLADAEEAVNQSRQPTPGERLARSQTPLARRGCANRWPLKPPELPQRHHTRLRRYQVCSPVSPCLTGSSTQAL